MVGSGWVWWALVGFGGLWLGCTCVDSAETSAATLRPEMETRATGVGELLREETSSSSTSLKTIAAMMCFGGDGCELEPPVGGDPSVCATSAMDVAR